MRAGFPCNESRVFSVRIDLQGVPCKPYRVWVYSAYILFYHRRKYRNSWIQPRLFKTPTFASFHAKIRHFGIHHTIAMWRFQSRWNWWSMGFGTSRYICALTRAVWLSSCSTEWVISKVNVCLLWIEHSCIHNRLVKAGLLKKQVLLLYHEKHPLQPQFRRLWSHCMAISC